MKFPNRNYLLIFSIIAIISVLFTFNKNFYINRLWSLWVGDEIKWREEKLNIDNSFFVFPGFDDEYVAFGRFVKNKVAFPDKNIIVVYYSANLNGKLYYLIKKNCNLRLSCRNFREYLFPPVHEKIYCIEFNAHLDSWGDRNFHVYCDVNKTTVEFHGDTDMFQFFKQQFYTTIKDVTKTIKEEP